MIEYNNIYNGLFDIIDAAIGQYLARTSNDLPMIYEFGDGSEYGTYPYVLIERGVTYNRQGALNLNQYIDDNDDLITERAKTINYNIRVVGSGAVQAEGLYRSSDELASMLEGFLSSQIAHTIFSEQVNCSALGLISNIVPFRNTTGNQVLESSNLSLSVNTRLVHTQENPDIIETIVGSGDLYRNREDQNPLQIDITAENN